MRILLTGSSGQVGRALKPLLQTRGTLITPNRAEFNLSEVMALERGLNEFKPDLIINPAAYTAVDRAEDDRETAFLINSTAPSVMAQWAAKRRVPLVHFSTDYVFDGSGVRAWHEDDQTGPLCVYGQSKLAGDTAVATSGAPCLILRTSWVYASKGANFLSTIARLARERDELRIVSDQIGAPTSASVIAESLVKILDDNLDSLDRMMIDHGGVMNLTCAGETSWHGFARAIVDGLRTRGSTVAVRSIIPIPTSEYPTRARRPANSRLDLSRLHDVFGISVPDWHGALSRELDLLAAAR